MTKKYTLVDDTVKSRFTYGGCLFSLLEKQDKNTFKTLLGFSSCRSYMCDSLFKMKNPTYKDNPVYHFTFDYKKGSIFIGLKFDSLEMKNMFISNLPLLHKKEEQAGTKKSKVLHVKDNNKILIIEGSRYWKDSCWKMMLYTFYLKTIGYKDPKECDYHYWESLEGHEDILISKVKMHYNKEIFDKTVYGVGNSFGMHSKEGFVSICEGSNLPMSKLLGLKHD